MAFWQDLKKNQLKRDYLVDRNDPLRQLAEEKTRSISLKGSKKAINNCDHVSRANLHKHLKIIRAC